MQLEWWGKQKFSSLIALCMVLIVILVCVRLGFWQLQRAAQKQHYLNTIQAVQTQGTLTWSQLNDLPTNINKTGVQVKLTGRFASSRYWLLDNQVYQAKVGYDLLTLFVVEDENRALLVNLGWVPAPMLRSKLPEISLPSEPFTFVAQLKQDNLVGFNLDHTSASEPLNLQQRVQTIDLDKFAKQEKLSLFPFIAYRQGPGDALATPHYNAVVMSPQKHRAYALQWFLLAVAGIAVAIFARKKRIENEK